jgi:hypothetical protein
MDGETEISWTESVARLGMRAPVGLHRSLLVLETVDGDFKPLAYSVVLTKFDDHEYYHLWLASLHALSSFCNKKLMK